MNLKDRFNKYKDEYNKFDDCTRKYVYRPDLNAMILLNMIDLPSRGIPIISAALHGEIYFSIDVSLLDNVEDSVILDLIRCGIAYDEVYNCLYKIV